MADTEGGFFSTSWVNDLAQTYTSITSGETAKKEAENEAKRINLEASQRTYENATARANTAPQQTITSGIDTKTALMIGGGVLALVLIAK